MAVRSASSRRSVLASVIQKLLSAQGNGTVVAIIWPFCDGNQICFLKLAFLRCSDSGGNTVFGKMHTASSKRRGFQIHQTARVFSKNSTIYVFAYSFRFAVLSPCGQNVTKQTTWGFINKKTRAISFLRNYLATSNPQIQSFSIFEENPFSRFMKEKK